MKKILLILLLPIFTWAANFTPAAMMTNVSMAASSNSIGVDVNQLNLMSIQAYWPSTGTPVGTLKVQVSNDRVSVSTTSDPAANVVNWTDYTGSTTTVNGAGDVLYNMTFAGYRWARLVYTRTSGTGTLNASFSGKGNM